MKKADVTSDEKTLDAFIADPQKSIPGNVMPYPGVADGKRPADDPACLSPMKAYQVVEFGAPLVSRNPPDPAPQAGAVVVDVMSCGLCHTDVHLQQGHIGLGGDQKLPVSALGIYAPATLGHEIYGRIAAFGPSSGPGRADLGRRVIVYPWIGCGRCQACLAGRDNECPKPESLGLQRPGGHGEKVVVRDAKFLVAADGLDPGYAGILACCGLTGDSALRKIVRREGPIGIIGMGGLGLSQLRAAVYPP